MMSVATRPVKLPLTNTEDVSVPSKKPRTSPSAPAPPAVQLPQPWMMPAAAPAPAAPPPSSAAPAPAPAPAPGMPGPMMMPPMPYFMPPPMMAPQMMAMQACMMMQMQMQAMQAMFQQHQQQQQAAAPDAHSLDCKPSAATAAAASLNHGAPLPCYPAFAFMPQMNPAMCFPPAPAPAPTPQQAVVQPLAPPPPPPRPSPSPSPAPLPDIDSTNLSDKDFAAFIDSFVGEEGDEPLQLLQLAGGGGPAPAAGGGGAGPCLIKLEALQGGGSMHSCSGTESTEADDTFSFSLDELLPWDAVTSQVESVLGSAFPPRAPLSSGAAAAGCRRALVDPHEAEAEGEESDLIFGVCPLLDSLLPGC